ncbi:MULTISPECIES: demethylmenaquinone methyltransferase [Oceanobacillus]|uniref:Demethylmenaquinone methyltransferase n=1 Tax=Oceanobacillus kimchii TaxID=746691 RepID=A0ABQ5THU5_9BACI|nr:MULTISPECIES: demethylmenaquinone methyltransferase [Oceanobacillus]MBT2598459.1 demethylmenaquinone methyltransferase [Oceanobacillus sp. ISL-74]MBT2651377.1 demethylmenaquinone methyltransferase [Oceanobacillus sp. ISL-73]MCT1576036.1 demethylmenaquinone methyltransferase [Oceanobacillus kimchii]MCT2135673.1 demethylmenaquinone methyltransferase [Oceanobacillus kimchii]GLO66444.1 demethylmenaquinone methyltransferase [Oceanobacillus kimchii]
MGKPSSKEERVHHVFENIYSNYDSMNSIISFQRHKAWRKDTMKRMNVQAGETALDVCCGTGDWTVSLAEAVGQTGEVIGLDFSQNMLSIAKQKKQDMQLNQLELIHGNAMELPYEENSFDYVTIGFGLRNVPDYMTVLKEMYRVVKPGGKVVCIETSQPTLIGYRQAYYFYFKFIMPILGKLIAKSYKEYSWLQESAKDFPGKKKLKEMFLNAGFERVEVKSYTGGVAAMHMGFKAAQ